MATPKKKRPGVLETARRTGISPAHISKILSGKRNPSLTAAALIANAWKMSLDELYCILVERQQQAAIAQPSVPYVQASTPASA